MSNSCQTLISFTLFPFLIYWAYAHMHTSQYPSSQSSTLFSLHTIYVDPFLPNCGEANIVHDFFLINSSITAHTTPGSKPSHNPFPFSFLLSQKPQPFRCVFLTPNTNEFPLVHISHTSFHLHISPIPIIFKLTTLRSSPLLLLPFPRKLKTLTHLWPLLINPHQGHWQMARLAQSYFPEGHKHLNCVFKSLKNTADIRCHLTTVPPYGCINIILYLLSIFSVLMLFCFIISNTLLFRVN